MKSSFVVILGIFLFAHSQGASAAPSEFPIARLQGHFSYHDQFQVPQMRRAETVDIQNPAGEKRAQSLRAEGYDCIHKNQVTLLCSKVWAPTQLPAGLAESVKKFMTPVIVVFSGGTTPPVLVHDGSTTQEWDVHEKVMALGNELNMYRVVQTNKNQVFIALPINESQPLTPLLYNSPTNLSIDIVTNNKDTATSTTSYTIRAYLERAP